MTDSQSPRPGSARAKLEAFDRMNRGRDRMMKKFLIIVALLLVAMVIQFVVSRSSDHTGYFEVPRDAAWLAREGKWGELRDLLTDDFEVKGVSQFSGPDEALAFLKGFSDGGLQVYTTFPHSWVSTKSGSAVVDFWIIWATGNVAKGDSIPLKKSWLVRAHMIEDGGWKISSVLIHPTMTRPEAQIDLKKLMEGR